MFVLIQNARNKFQPINDVDVLVNENAGMLYIEALRDWLPNVPVILINNTYLYVFFT